MVEGETSPLTKKEKNALFAMGAVTLYQNQKMNSLVARMHAAQELQQSLVVEKANALESAVQRGNLIQENSLKVQQSSLEVLKAKEHQRKLESETIELGFQVNKHIEAAETISDVAARFFVLYTIAQLVDNFELTTKNVNSTQEKRILDGILRRLENHRKSILDVIANGGCIDLKELIEADTNYQSRWGLIENVQDDIKVLHNKRLELEGQISQIKHLNTAEFAAKYRPLPDAQKINAILKAGSFILSFALVAILTERSLELWVSLLIAVVVATILYSVLQKYIAIPKRVGKAKAREIQIRAREIESITRSMLDQETLLEAHENDLLDLKERYRLFLSRHPDAGSLELLG